MKVLDLVSINNNRALMRCSDCSNYLEMDIEQTTTINECACDFGEVLPHMTVRVVVLNIVTRKWVFASMQFRSEAEAISYVGTTKFQSIRKGINVSLCYQFTSNK